MSAEDYIDFEDWSPPTYFDSSSGPFDVSRGRGRPPKIISAHTRFFFTWGSDLGYYPLYSNFK